MSSHLLAEAAQHVEQNGRPMQGEAHVVLTGISHSFGANAVINSLDLSVRRGELLCLLGPSGCGKTTTLSIIAGFVRPDSGNLSVDGADITDTPPHKRGLGMVFQNYALFPHMSIYENVAFGLRRQKVAAAEIEDRVREALAAVKLEHTVARYPAALSGGEQQRVGLARALAVRPSVLLMDEPLSNLDAKLRREMQIEIRRIHDQYGLTSVYVTHDQEEAMALGDRIAVMRGGVIEQLGAPQEIYVSPKTEFVARFVGERNFFSGTVTKVDPQSFVMIDEHGPEIRVTRSGTPTVTVDDRVVVAVREESVDLLPPDDNRDNSWSGSIRQLSYRGGRTQCVLDTELGSVRVQVDSARAGGYRRGDSIRVCFSDGVLAVVDRSSPFNTDMGGAKAGRP